MIDSMGMEEGETWVEEGVGWGGGGEGRRRGVRDECGCVKMVYPYNGG